MALEIASRVGPYVVESLIGEGGMGTVYRARDTRLDRLVALKVLAEERAAGAEAKKRFLQEAKAASALNHPNIVTVYDVGSDRVEYLAMELIDGKTLDQLIPRGGMKLSDLLRYAVQAADALGKAHQAGIVHRDLKPSNVMISADGLVKVLDFGLAKVTQAAAAAEPGATQSMALTGTGSVMGTPYYMSPEQAEAKIVDARSDIFSFGVMLYEMAAGARPFTGESQAGVLASILREEPKPLARHIPAEVARVIARCLRKDPARRFQDMADLKVALEELKEEEDAGLLTVFPAGAPVRANRPWIWGAGALALVAIGAAGWRLAMPTQPQETAFRASPLTSYPGLEDTPSFSPDGTQVVFSWNGDKEDNSDIYLKLIGPGAPLRLTTSPAEDAFPRWSPDGRSIAFVRMQPGQDEDAKFSVFVIPALGGPERRLATFANHGDRWLFSLPSLCWTPDSKALIVSAAAAVQSPNRLMLVPLDGGPITQLTDPKRTVYGDTRPVLTKDGRKLAFIRENDSVFGVFVQTLSGEWKPQGPAMEIELKERLVTGLDWMPGDRELLFADGLTNSSLLFRIAARPGATPNPLPGTGAGAASPSVSRDGHRLAYVVQTVDSNLWAVDLPAKTASPERALSSSVSDVFPQFSPDGKRVLFYSYRDGPAQIFVANRDGSQMQVLTTLAGPITASPRWSPDGQQIAFDSNTGGEFRVYLMAVDGGHPHLLTNHDSVWGSNWSHDGRWVYFASNNGGVYDVWKAPPEGGTPVRVTHGGGVWPTESPDGKTLYFTKETGAPGLWRVPVEGGQETLVLADVRRANYAVTDKGIYFTLRAGTDGKSSLQFYNFANQSVTEIVKLPKPLDDGLTVSPDGRTVMYSQIDHLGQDLMVVENLR